MIPFAASYLCECSCFSAITVIKSKCTAKLNIEKEMSIVITKIMPRYN